MQEHPYASEEELDSRLLFRVLGRTSRAKRIAVLFDGAKERWRASVKRYTESMQHQQVRAASLLVGLLLMLNGAFSLSAQEKKNPKFDISPKLIHKTNPSYTRSAARLRIQGTVELRFIVSTAGRAENIEVVGSLDPDLDKEAIKAVSKWRFEPGKKDGAPIPVLSRAEVRFRVP